MRLLGLQMLEAFKKRHANSRASLDAWRNEVENTETQWGGPQDIKIRYPNASFLANNRAIFNIKGNNYRLVVKVKYQNGIVLIEWVGTHAEYDKQKF